MPCEVCADDLVGVQKGQHRGCTELIPWVKTPLERALSPNISGDGNWKSGGSWEV